MYQATQWRYTVESDVRPAEHPAVLIFFDQLSCERKLHSPRSFIERDQ
jgi:hypothetical protein